MVANVRSGRRTRRPRSRSPANACGEVTSWTRWRSMYSTAGRPGSAATTWASQILSYSVRGVMAASARPLGGRRFVISVIVMDVVLGGEQAIERAQVGPRARHDDVGVGAGAVEHAGARRGARRAPAVIGLADPHRDVAERVDALGHGVDRELDQL